LQHRAARRKRLAFVGTSPSGLSALARRACRRLSFVHFFQQRPLHGPERCRGARLPLPALYPSSRRRQDDYYSPAGRTTRRHRRVGIENPRSAPIRLVEYALKSEISDSGVTAVRLADQRARSGANSVDGRIAGLVDNDAACLHHPTHCADGHLDVGKGIAFDGNNIGHIARCDRTERLLQAEHLCR
jgi:hypothetical protein